MKYLYDLFLPCIFFGITTDFVLVKSDSATVLNQYKSTMASAYLIATQEQLNIHAMYTFTTPQLHIDCKCNCIDDQSLTNNIKQSENQSCNVAYQITNQDEHFCYPICHIRVKPHRNITEQLTAIKINQTPKKVTNRIQFQIGSQLYTLDVPRGINKLIINDTLVDITKEDFTSNTLSSYDWFFGNGQDQLKNLRTTDSINELNESNLNKLGWFQRPPTQTSFTCRQDEILSNFKLLYHNCQDLTFQHELNASHYYNHNQLLQNEITSTSIQQLSSVPIDNVDVDLPRKLVTISYKKSLSQRIKMSLLDWKDGFAFTASIRLDRFANRLLTLYILEQIIDQVIVDIGIPETTVHTITIHHNGKPMGYSIRLSAKVSVVGGQWLCVYPLKNTTRETCRHVMYDHQGFLNPTLNAESLKLNPVSESINQNYEGVANSAKHLAPAIAFITLLPVVKTLQDCVY